MTVTLGIMVHRMADRDSYRPYLWAAAQAGFDGVIVFTPGDMNLCLKRVDGWAWASLTGSSGPVGMSGSIVDMEVGHKEGLPYPDIIYDIGYYPNKKAIQSAAMVRSRSGIRFAADWLGSKWEVHQKLAPSPRLAPHLLPTEKVEGAHDVFAMLDRYPCVALKPVSSHGGKGIVKLSREQADYRWEENDKCQITFTREQLEEAVAKLRRKRVYLVQRWVDVRDLDGCVYDVRVYVHRHLDEGWQFCAMGVRQGCQGLITSNLATGGDAFEVLPYLTRQFGHAQAGSLTEKLQELSMHMAVYLERDLGKRLLHLGMDYAIDRAGNIWLLEMNTKPGRKIVSKFGGEGAEEQSYLLPVQQAYREAVAWKGR